MELPTVDEPVRTQSISIDTEEVISTNTHEPEEVTPIRSIFSDFVHSKP